MVLVARHSSADGPVLADGSAHCPHSSATYPTAATAPANLGQSVASALNREFQLRNSLSSKDLEALFREGASREEFGMSESSVAPLAEAPLLTLEPVESEPRKAPNSPASKGGLRLPDAVLRKLCNIVTGKQRRESESREQPATSSTRSSVDDGEHESAATVTPHERAPRSSSRLSLDLPGAVKCSKRILLDTDRIVEGEAYHMKKSTSTDSLFALHHEGGASGLSQQSLASGTNQVKKYGANRSSGGVNKNNVWKTQYGEEQKEALPWASEAVQTKANAEKPEAETAQPAGLVCSSSRGLPHVECKHDLKRSNTVGGGRASLSASVTAKMGGNSTSEEFFFRLSRARQTMDFVRRQYQRFGTLDRSELTVFEALAKLDTVHEFEANLLVDNVADTRLSQLEHSFQTAEILRAAYPKDDWLHLVGLIHGLGKLLCHEDFGKEPQWSVFGESFPVGCRFSEAIRHHQLFYANPDRRNRQHNSPDGIYAPGCGLHEVNLSWSAAEYLYLVLYLNGTDFPNEALYCIRYQRFDSMVQAGAYKSLMSPEVRTAYFTDSVLSFVLEHLPSFP